MRRKIILNYCLPIENLETLYRSVKKIKRILFQLSYIASIPKPQMFKIFPELHLSSLFSAEHWQQHEVLFQWREAWCFTQPSTRLASGIVLIRASEVAPSAAGPRE